LKVGVIPLRSGSKGIPGKNKKELVGRPLYSWALSEALESALDRIIVYSDDEEILEEVRLRYDAAGKAIAMRRPDHTASDGASTESALIELSRQIDYDFETLALIQATSPLTRASDIDRALAAVTSDGYDSSLTVVREKRFHWTDDGQPLDYDPAARPRRQDFRGQLTENGAVYVTTREAFVRSGSRLSGRIATIEMDAESLVEIDEKTDWPLIEALTEAKLRSMRAGPPERVRVLFLDVDGVLTDGRVSVGPEGEAAKDFSLIDGMGIALARKAGIEIVIMTREESPIVSARMAKLGIRLFFPGAFDKYHLSRLILAELGINRRQAAFIGDDINDLACLLSSGLSFCPSDARPVARRAADIVLSAPGGRGAVREACDFLIQFNARWEA
jgi:YrbI family 3-deoxy-D-manno-octulosonate 8-phosphate phosphatase